MTIERTIAEALELDADIVRAYGSGLAEEADEDHAVNLLLALAADSPRDGAETSAAFAALPFKAFVRQSPGKKPTMQDPARFAASPAFSTLAEALLGTIGGYWNSTEGVMPPAVPAWITLRVDSQGCRRAALHYAAFTPAGDDDGEAILYFFDGPNSDFCGPFLKVTHISGAALRQVANSLPKAAASPPINEDHDHATVP